MSNDHEFTAHLREMIQRKQVVTVIGSGVSMATTPQAPAWRDLIVSAIQRCRALGSSERWCKNVAERLDFTDEKMNPDIADALLSAAEDVERKLRQCAGEWPAWLRASFGTLKPADHTLIQSLAALDTPLVTTNYDDLLSTVTKLKHVTWKDPRNAARVLRGEERRVLHLHGHWDEPASVVLGIRGYETVLHHEYIQTAMKAIGMTKSILLVGCGDEGLADPNFGSFLNWLAAIDTFSDVEHRHYRLVRRHENVTRLGKLFPLPYGDDYAELPAFLQSLASGTSSPAELGLPDDITPVLLRFRNLSLAALSEENGLRTFLRDETRNASAPDGLAEPGDDLWNGHGGNLLWILDGLDEVIDPVARRNVSRWIQQALEGRTGDWFLVTCRFAGYFLREGVPLGPKFVRYDVRPLDDAQIERFVRDWFATAYRLLLHSAGLAKERADKLLDILARPAYQAGHVRELCTNSLLLTILCIVFHDEQTLPTNRAELYAHCVRVLLQHWRRDLYESEMGRAIAPFDAEAAQAVLARVAWWMHGEQDRSSAPLDELAAEAQRGLAEVATSSGLGQDGLAFVQRMRDETGVLASEGDGRCGFLHLSFQEHLAAEYAAREAKAEQLAARVVDSWWREVALLSLRHSRPYCELFFRALLAAGIAETHPDVADRCLTETRFFSAAPFMDALRAADSPRRVAAVLRMLRERVETVPELGELARPLAASDDPDTRSLVREILARLDMEPPTMSGEQQVDIDERTGIAFVRMPAGEFQMGSEVGPYDDERPVHRVQITRDFWLGKYPVTNAQYAQFLKQAQHVVENPALWDDRRFNQPEQPVVGVSWEDAEEFCQWAGCRLPTEAEWEYACRAGTTSEFSFGDDEALLDEFGWFDENSGDQTQPVGTKKPNDWDLYDMHGNVWEWCQDWLGPYASDTQTDPRGPDAGQGRVLRGGSWYLTRRNCRSAVRDGIGPVLRVINIGFRAART